MVPPPKLRPALGLPALLALSACASDDTPPPRVDFATLQAHRHVPSTNVPAGLRVLGRSPAPSAGYDHPLRLEAAIRAGERTPLRGDEALPASVEELCDLGYGEPEEPAQRLDLYRPRSRSGGLPWVALVPPSGWFGGTRAALRPLAVELARRGFAALCIDHRSAAVAPYPAASDDLRRALAWAHRHGAELDLAPARFALLGAESGAQVALELAFDPAGLPAPPACVVVLSGWTDLEDPTGIAEPYVEHYLGASRSAAPELWRAASPLRMAHADAPPVLLLHGTLDRVAPIAHAEALERRLVELRVPFVYAPFPGAEHGFERFAETLPEVAEWIERFLAELGGLVPVEDAPSAAEANEATAPSR